MPLVGIRSGRAALAIASCVLAVSTAPAASSSVGLPPVQLSDTNHVPECVTPHRLTSFLKSRNPRLSRRYERLARRYATTGQDIGVRWDIAFFQMMVETANLAFRRPDGTPGDVAPQQNNFAGLGAVGDGGPGESFTSQADGVRAHLEHVLHYAGATISNPTAERTRKVQDWRTLADWHQKFDGPISYADLADRWAPHSRAYRDSIELLANLFQRRYCQNRPVLMVANRSQQPMIARTAWRFRKSDGQTSTAGTVPPTGRPNLKFNRKALGMSRHASIIPRPRPVTQPPSRPQTRPLTRRARPVRPRPATTRKARASSRQTAPPPRRTASRPIARPLNQTATRAKQASQHQRPKISANDRIRQMLSDRKVLLRTHIGAVIPIIYRSNGNMVGQAGNLAFFLGSSRDAGKWWAEKGKLCQRWQIWLDRETHCMSLKEDHGVIYWRANSGKSGTARIVSR